MLKIIEVETKAKFDQLRANENGQNDILYIRKYASDMVMSDNNERLVKFTSDDVDVDDLVSDTVDDILELENPSQNEED